MLDCLPSCARACVLCLQIDLIPSVLVIYQHIISYIGSDRERERKLKMDQKSLDARVAEELLVWSTGSVGSDHSAI